jgi:hypothetical protein
VSGKLARAERLLNIDGLFIRLNPDGSGTVTSYARADEVDIFRFDTSVNPATNLNQLREWLRSPRVVAYNDEGDLADAVAVQ